jgi:PTS system beta-glucosides-specific IIC component
MALDKKKIAQDVVQALGGADNVANVVHCATRLRFNLKDEARADIPRAKKVQGVIAVVVRGGQHQVVIGNTVPEVYAEVVNIVGVGNLQGGGGQIKGNIAVRILNSLIDTIAGIFPPILGPMVGAGLIKGLTAILIASKAITADSDTYILFNAMGDALFFFLPIMLGFAAGRKFGGNQYLTACIGAVLVYPNLVAAAQGFGADFAPFGFTFRLVNFSSTVLPILIASWCCVKLEKWLRSWLPNAVKNFFTPMLCILIVVPVTILTIGPAADWLAGKLAEGLSYTPPWINGLVIGALWQVLVIFGMHWAFIPLMINNVTVNGLDNTFGPFAGAASMSQTGAALGMALKMKNKKAKSAALGSVVSGIFGITEPIIYGMTLPRKKPFIIGVIGGAVAGLIVGLMEGTSYTMGGLGILALPNYIHPKDGIGLSFWAFIVGQVVALVLPAILIMLLWKDDTMDDEAEGLAVQGNVATGNATIVASNNTQLYEQPNAYGSRKSRLTITSPMLGKTIPMAQASDPVFAEQVMGQGALIIPEEGKLSAPCDGKITIVADTKHMIGMIGSNGAEIIMHIGIDTVNLGGKYFNTHVSVGDMVIAGQQLVDFDIQGIRNEGYLLETPCIVANHANFESFKIVAAADVKIGDPIIDID